MTPPPVYLVRKQRAALEDSLLCAAHSAEHSLALSQSLDRLITHSMRVRRDRFTRVEGRAVRARRQLRDSLMTPLL